MRFWGNKELEYRAGGQLRLSVIVFLSLQHRVVVGGKLGPLHSHSCSVEIEVSPPRGDTIPFAEIETEIKAQITPLDGKTLNDLANFQGINPTVENFAAHLYNRLSLIAAEYGAVLHSVIVRESPTRAVKYLREAAYMATSAWDGDEDRRPQKVLRLPVAPTEDPEINNVRRARSPVERLPQSPNQRPSSDFEPMPEPAGEAADGEPKVLGWNAAAAESFDSPPQGPAPFIPAQLATERPRRPAHAPSDPVASAADASLWAASEATRDAVSPVREARRSGDGPSAGSAPASIPASNAGDEVDDEGSRYRPAPAAASYYEPYRSASLMPLPSRKQRKKTARRKPGLPSYQPDGSEKAAVGDSMSAVPPVKSAGGFVTKALPPRGSGSGPEDEEPDGEPSVPFRKRTGLITCCILLVFLGATAFLYRRILWPLPGQGYPWGSDTWGHIKKAQFLLQEILNKNYFPSFSPMWYNGVEPFRYWAPLPYYLLAGLMRVLGDPFLAAAWYVAVCAFIGGAGWLLMKNRLGLLGSGLAGFIWLFWQDNIRVAMSEGNLPWTLAIGLFPYLLHCFLLVLEKPEFKYIGRFAALAAVSSIVILTHAMIAATFFIGLTLLGFAWALWMGTRVRAVLRGVLGVFAGIGLSAWWLVPSLQNGLMAVNKEAVSEAMQYFPIKISMNPFIRLREPEIFYWGLSLAAVAAIIVATWRKRSRLAQSSIFVGLAFVAVSTPTLKPVYSSIPMNHLIIPLRLATVASGIFILAALSWRRDGNETRRGVLVRVGVSVLAALVLAIDAYPSTALVNTRTEPAFLKDLSRHMPGDGWREATLDLSRFGSAATYILGQESNRELVYGWAWQGATTGQNIVDLNTALEYDYYPYLADRLVEMGATHLVVRRGVLDESRFLSVAGHSGYKENWRSSEALVLTAPGGPYALKTDYRGLVIGKFAPNWVKLFPSLAMGKWNQIDKYSLQDLERYKAIVVSGATWEDRTRAEELVSRLASSGKTVLIDLEGLPEDVLSKRPIFMGVTGEPVLLYRAPQLYVPGGSTPFGTLEAFSEEHYPWKALSPQGMDEVACQFPYLGETVAVLGSKVTGAGTIWYMGANLPYHAYLTRDPLALDLISRTLGIEPWTPPLRTKIQASDYVASARGYSLKLDVPVELAGTPLTIPIASRDNMIVRVDGVQVRFGSLHNLLSVTLDPGVHSIEIVPLYPGSMRDGGWVSLGCLAFLAIAMLGPVTARVVMPFRKQVAAE
jgi:uncharacterized membrane protein/6-pyruvoyl-tetrahydropterin synthase